MERVLEEKSVDGLIKKRKRKEDGRIIVYFSRRNEGEGD